MIGYVCIGTNDLARAARFYDELTAALGAKRQGETERYIGWGLSPTRFTAAADQAAGRQVRHRRERFDGLVAGQSKAQVDAVYKKALALGGKDEGPPGARERRLLRRVLPRPEGNKLAVYYSS